MLSQYLWLFFITGRYLVSMFRLCALCGFALDLLGMCTGRERGTSALSVPVAGFNHWQVLSTPHLNC